LTEFPTVEAARTKWILHAVLSGVIIKIAMPPFLAARAVAQTSFVNYGLHMFLTTCVAVCTHTASSIGRVFHDSFIINAFWGKSSSAFIIRRLGECHALINFGKQCGHEFGTNG
jgi:hypothetical protein